MSSNCFHVSNLAAIIILNNDLTYFQGIDTKVPSASIIINGFYNAHIHRNFNALCATYMTII